PRVTPGVVYLFAFRPLAQNFLQVVGCPTEGYLNSRDVKPLPPLALWPALPTSDYYGGTATAQVSPAASRLRFRAASHVHDRGLCTVGQVAGFRVTQAALRGIPSADRVSRWPVETRGAGKTDRPAPVARARTLYALCSLAVPHCACLRLHR